MLRTPTGQRRLDILEWLRDPATHFPGHRYVPEAGIASEAVAAKLGVSRQVADTHLELLADMGLLVARRVRLRTYYRRDEVRIAEVARMFEKGW
ncbi:helix-turn-helix domain-containing protein [Streptomyces sp. NPDC088196]|uniref:helix-turn-helix domain-containing protein n=1 Tax=Streptomyces sp. NPDC088196 TaxID=3154868 RepID=UPI00344B5536